MAKEIQENPDKAAEVEQALGHANVEISRLQSKDNTSMLCIQQFKARAELERSKRLVLAKRLCEALDEIKELKSEIKDLNECYVD